MTQPTRRVVTGHDPQGKAVVLVDGVAPNVRQRKATGLTSTLLWLTEESPADVSGNADRAEREIGVAPPPRGSIFRVVDFPPAADFGAVDNAAMRREMGLGQDGPGEGDARRAAMHRTKSIDYAVVISGEIDMLLDDSEVHLKAGDVLVQRGTNHAWVNRGKQNCRIAFVLIDAEEPLERRPPR
ncbi:MAG TPA: cupin domain-containing protein [Burkholderiales bacterium]